MLKFKKGLTIRLISFILLATFLSSHTLYASSDILRLQSQLQTEEGKDRFNLTALGEFYRTNYDVQGIAINEETALASIENSKETKIPILLANKSTVHITKAQAIKGIKSKKFVLGFKGEDILLLYTDPLEFHKASGETDEIIVQGVTLPSAVLSGQKIVFKLDDIEKILYKLNKGIDDLDTSAVIQMGDPEGEYSDSDLIKLLKKDNFRSLQALIAIYYFRGGQFTMTAGMPGIDRKTFLKITGLFTAAIALNPASTLTASAPQEPMTAEQKINLAKENIGKLTAIFNKARYYMIPIDLSNLTCGRERKSMTNPARERVKKKITSDLKNGFRELRRVKKLFGDKDTLKSVLSDIGETGYDAVLLTFWGLKKDLDMDALEGALDEVNQEQAGIAEYLVPRVKQIREQVQEIDELHKPPVVQGYAERIINWIENVRAKLYIGIMGWPDAPDEAQRLIKTLNVPGENESIYDQAVDDHMLQILIHGILGYDQALAGMALAKHGKDESDQDFIERTKRIADVYWSGRTGGLSNIRGNWGGPNDYANPFNYYENDPTVIGKDNNNKRTRGWPFKFISERYIITYKGRDITWSQWQPIAGEAAWIGIMCLQSLVLEHGADFKNQIDWKNDVRAQLAEEILRASLILQKDKENQGADLKPVPMAPRGTYHWLGMDHFNNTASLENNQSMLNFYEQYHELIGGYDETLHDGKEIKLSQGIQWIDEFLSWSHDSSKHEFCRGASFDIGSQTWTKDEVFATDVQLWASLSKGPKWIDDNLGGPGETFKIIENAMYKAGILDADGNLTGVDYSDTRNNRSAEWSIFMILACRDAATYYRKNPNVDPANADAWRTELMRWAGELYDGIVTSPDTRLVVERDNMLAVLYAELGLVYTKHGWIVPPEGVEHTAAGSWLNLVEKGLNPFKPGGGESIDTSVKDHRRLAEIDPTEQPISLEQNRPNPFTNRTTIPYSIDESIESLEIRIYNIEGKEVRSFNNLSKGVGKYRLKWNGLNNQGQKTKRGLYIIDYIIKDKNGDMIRIRNKPENKMMRSFIIGVPFIPEILKRAKGFIHNI
ncbi:MAG: FlgD immunoglobulin-like domain containing protein [Candidatus Gorgyraea atricola]|nr:FlgD immunoglobulin-like domain containing protein [Candidatus Gorgyraea atricola]